MLEYFKIFEVVREALAEALGCSVDEISFDNSVFQHFALRGYGEQEVGLYKENSLLVYLVRGGKDYGVVVRTLGGDESEACLKNSKSYGNYRFKCEHISCKEGFNQFYTFTESSCQRIIDSLNSIYADVLNAGYKVVYVSRKVNKDEVTLYREIERLD